MTQDLRTTIDPELATRSTLHATTVEAAQRGDQFAFAVLFEWSAPAIDAYLAPIASDQADELELLQRVFVRAWEELPLLPEAANFDVWLLRLAHDEVTKSLDTRAAATSPAHGGGSRLLRTVYELPRPYRETLALRYLFEHSTERAAAAFGVPTDLVARWDREALEELAEGGQTYRAAA